VTALRQILVIGVGNDYGGDDAVGHLVARELKAKMEGNTVRVVEEGGEGASLMEAWQGADVAIVIDAVRSAKVPGAIHRFEAETQPIPGRLFSYSTHAFSVAEAIEMARALDQLPAKLIVYGIEGKSFDPGGELSLEVRAAVDEAVQRISKEIVQRRGRT
jgi:hydrogenase maturation protease